MRRNSNGDCINMFRKLGVIALLFWIALGANAAPSEKLVWDQGSYDYIKLRETESGVTNTHPATVTPARLRALLSGIKVRGEKGEVIPLLTVEEAERLAKPFSDALRRVSAKEDVIFFTSEQRGDGIFAPRLGVTGRIFVTDQTLNLIIGTAHKQFVSELRGSHMMPYFSFGSRNERGTADLQADGARYAGAQNRRDWITWTAIGEPEPSERTNAAAPGTTSRTSPEERLRKLKQLWDQKLITEQEYKDKRSEILKDL